MNIFNTLLKDIYKIFSEYMYVIWNLDYVLSDIHDTQINPVAIFWKSKLNICKYEKKL